MEELTVRVYYSEAKYERDAEKMEEAGWRAARVVRQPRGHFSDWGRQVALGLPLFGVFLLSCMLCSIPSATGGGQGLLGTIVLLVGMAIIGILAITTRKGKTEIHVTYAWRG